MLLNIAMANHTHKTILKLLFVDVLQQPTDFSTTQTEDGGLNRWNAYFVQPEKEQLLLPGRPFVCHCSHGSGKHGTAS